MIDIRPLTSVGFDTLTAAFSEAFSDYDIPAHYTVETLTSLVVRRGFRADFAVGAFDGGRLVGFVFNCLDGDAAYNSGTGVAISHRRRGIARRLMQRSIEILPATRYVLEVLETNERAAALDREPGFTECRRFQCWRYAWNGGVGPDVGGLKPAALLPEWFDMERFAAAGARASRSSPSVTSEAALSSSPRTATSRSSTSATGIRRSPYFWRRTARNAPSGRSRSSAPCSMVRRQRRMCMPVRKAEAEWKGSLREGSGKVKLGSGAFEGAYSFASRFESGKGTNPEELIGAAHAGCFSMALSAGLGRAGFQPTRVHTTAAVHIDKVGEAFEITKIELDCEAQVPNISDSDFQGQATAAKEGCPVSKALKGTQISLKARLV